LDKGPWMTETVMLHVRVDERIKDAAALEAMGLTLTEAVRVFLVRVAAEQTIPFADRGSIEGTVQLGGRTDGCPRCRGLLA